MKSPTATRGNGRNRTENQQTGQSGEGAAEQRKELFSLTAKTASSVPICNIVVKMI